MPKRFVIALGILLAAVAIPALAQDARTVLSNAAKAMGAENLKTIQFSASGSQAGIGQNRNPYVAWPMVRVKSLKRSVDFQNKASGIERVIINANRTEQSQNAVINASSPWGQQYDYWLTPYAFLQGAMAASNPILETRMVYGTNYNVVSFMVQNRYKVSGYINTQTNLIERVETWIDHTLLGDMLVDATYRDWKEFAGVKFPIFSIIKQGGFPTLILTASEVRPNAAVTIEPAQQAQGGQQQQMSNVLTERVADGVFYIRGINHHSIAIEFADHVAVIEAPQNEERSLAVIAEVKRQIRNKPIRYLINTHHHFDHSGGLRTYVDEGATIVTHESNRQFYEQALRAPKTIDPDRLQRSKKAPVFDFVADKKVMTDGTRTLELHLIKNQTHNDGILMAFLPTEKMLIQVDMFTPPNPPAAGAAAPANPPAVNPNSVALAGEVERLKLDFEKILPLHGPGMVDRPALYGAIQKPVPDIQTILKPPEPPARRGGQRGNQQ